MSSIQNIVFTIPEIAQGNLKLLSHMPNKWRDQKI